MIFASSSSRLMNIGLQMSMIGSGRGSSAKRSSGSERKAEVVRFFFQVALARCREALVVGFCVGLARLVGDSLLVGEGCCLWG